MKVSAAEFVKNYGEIADRALSEPVTITSEGRDRLVVLSAQEYSRLKRRDRRVVTIDEFSDDDIRRIMSAEVPPGFEHLDEELENWRP